jgi:hypothetical protein
LVGVSYAVAETRSAHIASVEPFSEYSTDTQYIIQQFLEPLDHDSFATALHDVYDPESRKTQPPHPSIDLRFTELYEAPALVTPALSEKDIGVRSSGPDFFESGGLERVSWTEFAEPDGAHTFEWARPTTHRPRIDYWITYPPTPSINVEFFLGTDPPRLSLTSGGVVVSALRFDQEYSVLTAQPGGFTSLETGSYFIGGHYIALDQKDSLETDSAELAVDAEATLQWIGGSMPYGLQTLYGEYDKNDEWEDYTVSVAYHNRIDPRDHLSLEATNEERGTSIVVSNEFQYVYPDPATFFEQTNPLVSSRQYLPVRWHSSFDSDPHLLKRFNQLHMDNSHLSAEYGVPEINIPGTVEVLGALAPLTGYDEFSQIYNLKSFVFFEGLDYFAADAPLPWNLRHVLELDTPNPEETKYEKDWTFTVVNRNQEMRVLGVAHAEHSRPPITSVLHGLTIAPPDLSSLDVGEFRVSNWEQYVDPTPTQTDEHSDSPPFSSLENAADAFTVTPSTQTAYDPPLMGDQQEAVHWLFPQTAYGQNTVGTTRTVNFYERLSNNFFGRQKDTFIAFGERPVEPVERDMFLYDWSAFTIDPRIIKPNENPPFSEYEVPVVIDHSVRELGGGEYTKYGYPYIEFTFRGADVEGYSQFKFDPVSAIWQRNLEVVVEGFTQAQWSMFDIVNELDTEPVYPQFITPNGDDEGNMLLPPEEPNGDALHLHTIRSNGINVHFNKIEQTEYSDDTSVAAGNIKLWDGHSMTEFDYYYISTRDREITPELEDPLTEMGVAEFRTNVVEVAEGDDWLNKVQADETCKPYGRFFWVPERDIIVFVCSPPDVQNQHRTYVAESGYTFEDSDKEMVVSPRGGVDYIFPGSITSDIYGMPEMAPRDITSIVMEFESFEFDTAEDDPIEDDDVVYGITVTNPFDPVFDQTLEVAGTDQLGERTGRPHIELFNREVYPTGLGELTLYGDNTPMVHYPRVYEFGSTDPETETDLTWVSYVNRVLEMDESQEQTITWPADWGVDLTVWQNPQHIVPLDRDNLQTARPKVMI